MNEMETRKIAPPERPEGPMSEREPVKRERPPAPDRLIAQGDAGLREEIAAAQAETVKRLAGIDQTLAGEVPAALAGARQDAQAKLDANAAAMNDVAEGASREVQKILAAEAAARTLRDPNAEVDAALLIGLADVYPDDAVEGLIARGKDLSYDEKLAVLLPALAQDPELGAKLDDAGLSWAEKLGLVLRLGKESPVSFFRAAETAKLDLTPDEKKAIVQDMLERNPVLFPEAAAQFRLSHDDVVDIIREYHDEDAAVLLETLNIPVPEGAAPYVDFSPEEVAWLMEEERDPEKRETFEAVERAKGASRELMLAIESAFPERVDAERERFAAEQQLLRPIERVGELQKKKEEETANKPLYVNIEGRALPAVYKPKSREEVIRPGIKKGESMGREVLAAFIDRALKMDLVPPTVLRDGPEGIGTVQDWKVGKIAYRLGDEAYAEKHGEQLTRLAFFDWVTQNSDRHSGNWLVSPDGKHQAIDNGAILPARLTLFDGMRSFPSAKKAGTPLPPELRRNVEELLASKDVMAALRAGFDATLEEKDAERAWQEFVVRLEQVKDDPDFAIQPSEWTDFK